MKSVHVPYCTGDPFPENSVWLPLRPAEAEALLTAYKADVSRAWHTPTFRIYEQVGIGVFVSFTRWARPTELAELKEYLLDNR